MAKVINLPVITSLDLPPDRTLENLKGQLEGFIIAGFDKNGDEFFSTTYADGAEALWLLERCKRALLNAGEE